jgi:hypothetical protein
LCLEKAASQQEHQNKHKGRGCQRQIRKFRYDIGKNIAFGHGRLLTFPLPADLLGAGSKAAFYDTGLKSKS